MKVGPEALPLSVEVYSLCFDKEVKWSVYINNCSVLYKPVNMMLCSMFAVRHFKYTSHAEQGFLCIPVCYHLCEGKEEADRVLQTGKHPNQKWHWLDLDTLRLWLLEMCPLAPWQFKLTSTTVLTCRALGQLLPVEDMRQPTLAAGPWFAIMWFQLRLPQPEPHFREGKPVLLCHQRQLRGSTWLYACGTTSALCHQPLVLLESSGSSSST